MFKIIKKIAQRSKIKKAMPKPKKERRKIFKKLSPEQKEKLNKAIQKGAGEVLKYSQGKPKIIVKPAAKPKAAELNFFDKSYNLGLFEATGKQITIGGSVLLLGGIALSRLNK